MANILLSNEYATSLIQRTRTCITKLLILNIIKSNISQKEICKNAYRIRKNKLNSKEKDTPLE